MESAHRDTRLEGSRNEIGRLARSPTGRDHCASSRRQLERGLERDKGFEPSTSTLARLHSTTELVPQRGVDVNRGVGAVKEATVAAFGTPCSLEFTCSFS